MQGKVYKRITNIEREEISRSLATGIAVAEIAKALGRHRSSILREKQRNINPTVKRNSYYQYDLTVNKYILPYLGKFLLKEIRADQVQFLYKNLLEDGVVKTTVKAVHRILRRALKHAVNLGMILRNPTDAVQSPKIEKKEMKFYDEAQSNQLLMAVKDTRYDALFQLVLSTGMRESEVLGLKWSDLDWKNKTISIRRQLVRNGRGHLKCFGTLKTSAASRTISLGENTIEKLHKHFEFQNNDRLEFQNKNQKETSTSKWNENDLLFTTRLGSAIYQVNLLKTFNSICRRVGLPQIRFHDLRHTAASLMLNHGVPPIIVSKRLGHSKVSITMDVYGHMFPQMQNEVGQLMDDLISPVEIQLDTFSTSFEFTEKD